MRNNNPVLGFVLYPMLIAILGLGTVMFFATYQFILTILTVAHQNEWLASLGPYRYVQQAGSICGAIVMGIAALIAFPLADAHLRRKARQDGSLRRPFLRIVGIQIGYLGALLLISVLLVFI